MPSGSAGDGDGGTARVAGDHPAGGGGGTTTTEAEGGTGSRAADDHDGGGASGATTIGGPTGVGGDIEAGGSPSSNQLLGSDAPGNPLDSEAFETYALGYYGEWGGTGYLCPNQAGLPYCNTFGQGGSRPYVVSSPAACGTHAEATEFAGFGVVYGDSWHTSINDFYWTWGLDEKNDGTRGVSPWPATWNGVLLALELSKIDSVVHAIFSIDWDRHWWRTSSGVVEIDFTPEGLSPDVAAYPVIGRWRRDYGERLGLYQDGTFYVDWDGDNAWNAERDHVIHFSAPGDYPAAADFWPGGGDEVALYKDGNWYIDANQNGSWDGMAGGDLIISLGKGDGPGQIPTAGSLPVVARDGWKRDCD
jgi:hypothetical protein